MLWRWEGRLASSGEIQLTVNVTQLTGFRVLCTRIQLFLDFCKEFFLFFFLVPCHQTKGAKSTLKQSSARVVSTLTCLFFVGKLIVRSVVMNICNAGVQLYAPRFLPLGTYTNIGAGFQKTRLSTCVGTFGAFRAHSSYSAQASRCDNCKERECLGLLWKAHETSVGRSTALSSGICMLALLPLSKTGQRSSHPLCDTTYKSTHGGFGMHGKAKE